MCLCVHGHGGDLWESVLSFQQVDFGSCAQVRRPGGWCSPTEPVWLPTAGLLGTCWDELQGLTCQASFLSSVFLHLRCVRFRLSLPELPRPASYPPRNPGGLEIGSLLPQFVH